MALPQVERLSNGTYLVAVDRHDINLNNWNVSGNGIILGIKNETNKAYAASDIGKPIHDILKYDLGVSIPYGWSPEYK